MAAWSINTMAEYPEIFDYTACLIINGCASKNSAEITKLVFLDLWFNLNWDGESGRVIILAGLERGAPCSASLPRHQPGLCPELLTGLTGTFLTPGGSLLALPTETAQNKWREGGKCGFTLSSHLVVFSTPSLCQISRLFLLFPPAIPLSCMSASSGGSATMELQKVLSKSLLKPEAVSCSGRGIFAWQAVDNINNKWC